MNDTYSKKTNYVKRSINSLLLSSSILFSGCIYDKEPNYHDNYNPIIQINKKEYAYQGIEDILIKQDQDIQILKSIRPAKIIVKRSKGKAMMDGPEIYTKKGYPDRYKCDVKITENDKEYDDKEYDDKEYDDKEYDDKHHASKDKKRTNNDNNKDEQKKELIQIYNKFNSYINLIDKGSKLDSAKNIDKIYVEKLFNKIFEEDYYKPFISDLTDHCRKYKNESDLKDIIIDDMYKQNDLYPLIEYLETDAGIIPIPMLFTWFDEYDDKVMISDETIRYKSVLLDNNILKKPDIGIRARSWLSDKDRICHDIESYKMLYHSFKVKFFDKDKQLDDPDHKLVKKYVKRYFKDCFDDKRSDEGFLKFCSKIIEQDEMFLAAKKLFEKDVDLQINNGMSIEDIIETKDKFCLYNQINLNKDLDFHRIYLLRHTTKNKDDGLLNSVLKDYGCDDAKEFCDMSDEEIKEKTKKLLEHYNSIYRLLKDNKIKKDNKKRFDDKYKKSYNVRLC